MRRDYVTLDVRNTDLDGDDRPTAVLTFDGPGELIDDRLVDVDGPLDGERIDVAFRFQSPASDDDAGVLSLTNRVTGEFVLEVNTGADGVLDLVSAARTRDDDDGDGRYGVVVRHAGDDGDTEAVASYDKRTLLVYDDEGNLLRQHSLIPGGVEL